MYGRPFFYRMKKALFGDVFCRLQALLLVALCKEITEGEDEGNAQNDHQKRPELRGGNAGNELAACIVAQKLVKEAEDAVGDEVDGHIVAEILFEKEIGKNSKQNKQKCRFIELCGVNGNRKARELDTEEAIGGLAVAAACKEATNATKGVCNGDAAGSQGKDIKHATGQTGTHNEVDCQEGYNTANESAEEGDAAPEFEACGGIFDIIVGCLKECRRAKADRNGCNAVKENEVGKFFVNANTLCIKGEHEKARKNSNGEHNAVHMHV